MTKLTKQDLRTDFEHLEDGERITLYPNADNPLHKKPVTATYSGGYFYCDGSDLMEGPDYYLGDVLDYNDGFEIVKKGAEAREKILVPASASDGGPPVCAASRDGECCHYDNCPQKTNRQSHCPIDVARQEYCKEMYGNPSADWDAETEAGDD